MNENNMNETPQHAHQVVVSIADIKAWLKTGVTRRVGDPSYNAEIGSVQEKYNMSKAEVTALFQDSRLKGLKVSSPKPSRIIIAEDILPVEDVIPRSEPTLMSESFHQGSTTMSTPNYGDHNVDLNEEDNVVHHGML
jgi:hypothetical protein